MSLPGDRLPKLRQLLATRQWPLRILETHSGLSGLIAEHTAVDGRAYDGMWSSSLTASSVLGKPDIETVDTSARLGLVRETLSVTSKPMIYDGDTGGHHPEVFKFTVRALEELGVSACIIEDKAGLKQNSLFGTDRRPAWSKWPSWRRLSWPPAARQAAPEGLGLLYALGSSDPPPQIPSRGRSCPATGRPS